MAEKKFHIRVAFLADIWKRYRPMVTELASLEMEFCGGSSLQTHAEFLKDSSSKIIFEPELRKSRITSVGDWLQ